MSTRYRTTSVIAATVAFGLALVAAPSAQAAPTQIAKDRQAVNAVARSFLTLTSDAPRAAATVTALKTAGYDITVAAQATALSNLIDSAAFPGSAVDAVFTQYYGTAPALAFQAGVSVPVLRSDVALASIVTSPSYQAAGIANAASLLGSPTGWAVGSSTATIYDADLVKAFQSDEPYATQLSLVKKSGTWLVDLDRFADGTTYQKPPAIKTTLSGWKAKTVKVKKGKKAKSQKLVVAAATGSVTLQSKAGKKWKKVKSYKVNTSTGKVTIAFPKQKKAGKVRYRVSLTGTAYYTAKTSAVLTVKVK